MRKFKEKIEKSTCKTGRIIKEKQIKEERENRKKIKFSLKKNKSNR